MAAIYLSYRSGDNDAVAERLYDHLVERFGRDAVIWREPGSMNTTGGMAGEPGLRDSVAMVALIGPHWLHGAGASSDDTPPLAHPDDPVRLDLEAALRRRLPIILALTPGATLSQAPYLPSVLRPLTALSPLPLRNDPDFRRDVEHLAEALGRYVAPLAATRGVRGLSASAFALLVSAALLVIALSIVSVVFAARAGIGLFNTGAITAPTATPVIQRTPTLVTVMRDPLTTLVDYGNINDTWAVNVSGQCSFAAAGYQVIGAPDANHISLCAGPPSATAGDQRFSVTTRLATADNSHGVYGMYFRSGDSAASTGYEFAITPSGAWMLLDAKTGQSLGNGLASAIHTGPGAVNTLVVDAYGSLITLSVNNTRVGQVTDDSYVAGQCGAFVEHGLIVVYTNFTLQRYQ